MLTKINKKQLKHSKYKNTGILYELLCRQLTAEVLSDKPTLAYDLIKKYFSEDKELCKEKKLYNYILTEHIKDYSRADNFLQEMIRYRKKLSNKKLLEEKYNLIKEIKKLYPINDFLRAKLANYTEYASIYKIFEEASTDNLESDPKDIYKSKICLVEHITKTKKKVEISEQTDPSIEYYKNLNDPVLKNLTFKIVVDRFNEKYSGLNSDQMILLREYVNNISNTNSLKKYMDTEVDKVKREFNSIVLKIKDPVTKIKLKEVSSQLDNIKKINNVKDSHVEKLLFCYELIKEAKRIILNA